MKATAFDDMEGVEIENAANHEILSCAMVISDEFGARFAAVTQFPHAVLFHEPLGETAPDWADAPERVRNALAWIDSGAPQVEPASVFYWSDAASEWRVKTHRSAMDDHFRYLEAGLDNAHEVFQRILNFATQPILGSA